jgi:hypothetical protein
VWRFKATKINFVIVDEVVNYRNLKTKNTRMPSKIKKLDADLLMHSATAFEDSDKSMTLASAFEL